MKTKLHNQIRNYENIKWTNTLLYVLSHAPILAYFFHEDLVSEYEAKEGINLAINSIKYMLSLIKKIIYILLLLIFFEDVPSGFAFYFIILTITGSIKRKINKFDEKDYDNVILLRIESNKYVKYQINYYIVTEFILMSLAMILIHKQMNINYLLLVYLVLTYISIHLIQEALYIKKIKQKELNRSSILNTIITIIMLIPIVILRSSKIYLTNNIMFFISLIFIVLGLISYSFLINYKNYKKLHKENLNLDLINNMKIIRQNSNQAETKNIMDNKNIDKNAQGCDKKGYEYLYNMLLKRHQKTLKTEITIVNILILIAGIVALLLPVFMKSLDGKTYTNNIFNALAMLFFIMYYVSMLGKRVLNLCFFQIDRYLINYNFYRSSKAIEQNLKLRQKTIIKINILPTTLISIFLTLIFIIYSPKIELVKIIVVLILPYVLSIFFSIYHLTMYYLFQPYAFNGNVISKAYKTVDWIVYVMVAGLFYSEVKFNLLTILITAISLFIVSIILNKIVLKYGPKTFRVR